jgi:hypothetical protein
MLEYGWFFQILFIHYSLIILPFSAIWTALLTLHEINNKQINIAEAKIINYNLKFWLSLQLLNWMIAWLVDKGLKKDMEGKSHGLIWGLPHHMTEEITRHHKQPPVSPSHYLHSKMCGHFLTNNHVWKCDTT